MARVQVSIPDDTLAMIDQFAKDLSLSRSAFLSMAALDFIKAKKQAPVISQAFSDMAALLNMRVQGQITEEDFQLSMAGFDDQLRRLNDK